MGTDHAASAMMPLLRLLRDDAGRYGLDLLVGFAGRFRGCREALAVSQSGDRAALRDAFTVDVFEGVLFAGHDDVPIAQTCACDGQFTAETILGVGLHAAAAGRRVVAGRLKSETGRAATGAAAQLTTVADDVDGGLSWLRGGRVGIGETASARVVRMCVGRAQALAASIIGAADAGTGHARRRCWRRCPLRHTAAVPHLLPRKAVAVGLRL